MTTRNFSVILNVLFLSALAASAVDFFIPREETLAVLRDTDFAQFPDAETVLVDDATREFYRADGTGESVNEWYEKILTEKGLRNSRTQSAWMGTVYENLSWEQAEIIKADGAVVTIDTAENSKVMIDPGQMNANIYDPSNKVTVLSIPGLEIGDTIHLLVKRVTHKARAPGKFASSELFEREFPILRQSHVIDAPAELPLISVTLRNETGAGVAYSREDLDGGGTRHTWSVENVPQAFSEPQMPAFYTCAQRLLVSSVADWKELSRWYWNLCEPRMAATTPAMTNTVLEIVADVENDDEKIRRIFYHVAQNIRYMGVTAESEAPGYEPHDVSLTFDNKYGVCRDKAALLASMLRIAGFEAFPVLIHANEKRDPDAPSVYFNHAITAVRRDGVYTLMDPTSESVATLMPEYLAEKSYLVATPEGETLLESPALPAEQNKCLIETTGAISNGVLRAHTVIRFEGANDTIYRGALANMGADQIRRFTDGQIQRTVPGAVITGVKLTPSDMRETDTPLSLEIDYSIVNAVATSASNGVTVLTLPQIGGSFGYANFVVRQTSLKERRFPYKTEIPNCVEERMTIETPFVGMIFAGAGDIDSKCDVAEYAQKTEFSDDGVLTFGSRFAITKSLVETDAYADFKRVLKARETAFRSVPVWEISDNSQFQNFAISQFPTPLPPEKSNDILKILDEAVVTLDKDNNTIFAERHFINKILTQAGVKKGAEMKLYFNPVFEDERLVSASVTSPSGEVRQITALEMNLMDQGWVAGAPRYPAGKILAVSFPNVEIGSVIDCTYTTLWSDYPFLAWIEYFGGNDDTEKQTIIVREVSGGVTNEVARETRENIPGLIAEDNMPPTRYVRERFEHIATEGANGKFSPLDFAKATSAAFKTAAEKRHEKTAAKAREITEGKKTIYDKVDAIKVFTAKNIRRAGPYYYWLPLSYLSAPDDTLEAGYGHEADKIIMQMAMLRELGIEAKLMFADPTAVLSCFEFMSGTDPIVDYGGLANVFLEIKGNKETNYDDLYLFERSQYGDPRVIPWARYTYINPEETEDSAFWMDGNDGDYSTCVLGNSVYDIQNDGSAIVEIKTFYYGMNHESMRNTEIELTPEQHRRYVLRLAAAYSQDAELIGDYESDLENHPVVTKLKLRIPDFAVKQDGLWNIRVPRFPIDARLGERVNPFYQASPVKSDGVITILLPEEISEVLFIPEDTSLYGEDYVATVNHYKKNQNGRRSIQIIRGIHIDRTVIPDIVYDEYMRDAVKLLGRGADTIIAR
ncbi:MAG: DUF3857 domain-containing protein [Kiritimatiellaeota bacterium]|nr:DUF3857 domain-containing protein [Kiritimatiellota bacterium]